MSARPATLGLRSGHTVYGLARTHVLMDLVAAGRARLVAPRPQLEQAILRTRDAPGRDDCAARAQLRP